MTDPKDNSGGTVAADELRLLIERVEHINEKIEDFQLDRKDVYAEAKSRGYDTKTMRAVVRYRKMEKDKFQEMKALEDTYLAALGLD